MLLERCLVLRLSQNTSSIHSLGEQKQQEGPGAEGIVSIVALDDQRCLSLDDVRGGHTGRRRAAGGAERSHASTTR